MTEKVQLPQVGQSFMIRYQGQEYPYRLKKRLGEGLTGEVFMAQAEDKPLVKGADDVAVKVMKPGLPKDMQERFHAEAEILDRLANELRGWGVDRYLPAYYCQERGRYMVEEYVASPSITELLSGGKRLREEDALAIAEQFAWVLIGLHEKLQRTYTDMKLENIHWDQKAQCIKVLDWNVVSRQYRPQEGEEENQLLKDGVKADLLRFGAFLYQMLVGMPIQVHGDRVVERLDGAPAWAELTVGTRDILSQALHDNPDHRYQTAKELNRAVSAYRQLFTKSVTQLQQEGMQENDQGAHHFDQGDVEAAIRALREAVKKLDLAAHRCSWDGLQLDELTKGELARASEKLKLVQERYLTIGKEYFERTTDYARAEEKLLQAAGMLRDDLRPQRWLVACDAARSAPEKFAQIKPDVVQGLKGLDDKNYSQAAWVLGRLTQGGAWPALAGLLAEAQVWLSKEQAEVAARLGDHAQAAAHYRQAAEALKRVPYAEMVRHQVGNLVAAAREQDDRAGTEEKARQEVEQAQKALSQKEPERAWNYLREALRHDPRNEKAIGLCLEEGEVRLKAGREGDDPGEFLWAMRFLDLGLRAVPPEHQPRAFRERYEQARQHYQVQAAIDLGDYQDALDRLPRFRSDDPWAQRMRRRVNEAQKNTRWREFEQACSEALNILDGQPGTEVGKKVESLARSLQKDYADDAEMQQRVKEKMEEIRKRIDGLLKNARERHEKRILAYFGAALELVDCVLAVSPDHQNAFSLRGEIANSQYEFQGLQKKYQNAHDWQERVSVLKEAQEKGLRGWEKDGEIEELLARAEEELRRAQEEQARRVREAIQRAEEAYRDGNLDQAEELLKGYPKTPEVQELLLKVQQARGNKEKVAAALDQAGRFEEAAELCSKTIPSSAPPILLSAHELYRQVAEDLHPRHKKAQECMTRVAKRLDEVYKGGVEALVAQAERLVSQGEGEAARKLLEEARQVRFFFTENAAWRDGECQWMMEKIQARLPELATFLAWADAWYGAGQLKEATTMLALLTFPKVLELMTSEDQGKVQDLSQKVAAAQRFMDRDGEHSFSQDTFVAEDLNFAWQMLQDEAASTLPLACWDQTNVRRYLEEYAPGIIQASARDIKDERAFADAVANFFRVGQLYRLFQRKKGVKHEPPAR